MKLLVCGGRDYGDREHVWMVLAALDREACIDVLIQGGATGADTLARHWAQAIGVPFDHMPAEWNRYGKAAGSIRNQAMLDKWHPDQVLAFPGGSGTADMIRRAEAAGVKVIRDMGRR